MTYQKSSINTTRAMFKIKLKNSLVFGILQTLILSCAIPAVVLVKLISQKETLLQSATPQNLKDLYEYYLIFAPAEFRFILLFIICAFALLLGIRLFSFSVSKKTVNLFYSLGIKRRNMYFSSYLSGILTLTVSIIIPMVLCLLVNLSMIGYSKHLMIAFFILLSSFLVVSWLTFTVTTVIFTIAGTTIEGLFFSGMMLAAPTVFTAFIGFICERYLLGSAVFGFQNGRVDIINILSDTITGKFSVLSPIFFPMRNIENYGLITHEQAYTDPASYPMPEMVEWADPKYISILIWTGICLLLCLLGYYLFQRRKAEICGFIGTCKSMNFVMFLMITLAVFAILSVMSLNLLPTILIACAISVVIVGIVILILSKKAHMTLKNELLKVPVYLVACIACIFVFYTGMFGYSNRIPEASEIKNIQMTCINYDVFLNDIYPYYYSSYNRMYGLSDQIFTMTDKEDISTVTDIHKAFIEEKLREPSEKNDFEHASVRSNIKITYTLKNGKTVSRNYRAVNAKLADSMLRVTDTNTYKEKYVTTLQNYTYIDNIETRLCSVDSLNNTVADISFTERQNLIYAIIKDYQNMTLEQKQHPTSRAVGNIQLLQPDILYEYSKDINREIISTTDVLSAGVIIFVTEDMTNTIACLKDLKLYDLLKPTIKVTKAIISDFMPEDMPLYAPVNLSFVSSVNYRDEMYGSPEDGPFLFTASDRETIDYLRNNAYAYYFGSKKGYTVTFITENGKYSSTLFIPADKLPESVLSQLEEK